MAESVTIANMPDSGSRQAVALQMAQWINGRESNMQTKFDRAEFLKLYVDCLNATLGALPKQ